MKKTDLLFHPVSLLISLGFFFVPLRAQTPVMQWAFEARKGAPTNSTWISGGVLRIDGDGDGYAAFQPVGGVSPVTPGVLNCSANLYADTVGAVRIHSLDSPILAEADLAQFVVTMWIKPSVSSADQPYARLLNISEAETEKGVPGLMVAMHNGNLELSVNGGVAIVTLPAGSIRQNEWTFLALVYEGLSKNPYYCPDMLTAVKSEKNGAVLIGSQELPVKLAGATGFNRGAPTYNLPVGPLALNGLIVSIGSSNSSAGRPFVGMIDDVRIYSGLLTTAQIEDVRLSDLGK